MRKIPIGLDPHLIKIILLSGYSITMMNGTYKNIHWKKMFNGYTTQTASKSQRIKFSIYFNQLQHNIVQDMKNS